MDRVIPAAVALLCILSLALWLSGGKVQGLEERIPQADRPEVAEKAVKKPVSEAWTLIRSDGVPADFPGSWPRFRGNNFDGVAPDGPPLARSWPEGGPERLWSVNVGEGHAGPAVLDGRVYLLDYDQTERRDALLCLSLRDGAEIWRFSYPVDVMRQYGMSRTVPAVTEKSVVSFGPKCDVTCVDSRTGEFKWALDLVRDFGAHVPRWYAGQCPLIDDGKAIIAVGGDALMIAVDCETGRVVWRTPNAKHWEMTHSSVIPAEIAGRRMYVYCASGGVAGVAADTGELLWEFDRWQVTFASVPSPVMLGGGRIFLSGGYGAGSMMLQVKKQDDRFVPRPVWRIGQNTFGTEQHTAVFYGGHIYGVSTNQQLVCLDLSGNVVWSSGIAHKFAKGRGNYLVADGLLFVMSDTGMLTLVEATPAGYRELAKAQVLPGQDAYGPMAIADGRLIVRDLNILRCLDVRRK